jgi:hypothetical protein
MVGFCLLLSTVAFADGRKATDIPLKPLALLEQLDREGPASVAKRLSEKQWAIVIKNIETGRRPWIEIAKRLHTVSDAGTSEMLSLATGVALVHAPRDVLAIASVELTVAGVCGLPDMTDARTDTQRKVVAYLDARLKSVRGVKGKDTGSLRLQCLQALTNARDLTVSPTGPFSRGT